MDHDYFDDAFVEGQRRDGPMTHWLENSPWDPMAVNSPSNSFHTPSVSQAPSNSHTINPRANFAFHDWRSTGLPSASDCETIPGGDSGYGSLMPGHIDNTSTQGDDTITSSIPDVENELGGFHLTNHDTQASGLQFTVNDAPSDFNTTSPGSSRTPQMCTECNAPVRTKSEMNKHLQRHKKPHTCSYQDCSRNANGFASNNDLVRHKRTVHGEMSNGRSFVCRHDPCIKKDVKLWPRADNFRSHLLRVHKIKVKAEDDLRDYVYQQQRQSQDLEGIGTNLQDPGSLDEEAARADCMPRTSAILEFPEIPPQSLPAAPHLHTSVYGHNHNLMVPSRYYMGRITGRPVMNYGNTQTQVMEDMKPALQSHSQSTRFEPPRQDLHKPIVSVNTTMDYSSPMEVMDQSPRQPTLPTPTEAPTQPESDNDSDDESKESIVSSSASGSPTLQQNLDQLKDVKPVDQLEYLKRLPKELLQKALESQSQNAEDLNESSPPSSKPKTACTTCEKTFNRPCELRKHNKRHEKPYGCTWYQCNRAFGSKNDWKRHETNQHGQIETWHCPHDCRKVYNNRESFKNHLLSDHKITDGETLERNLEESRQGSHCTDTFWCGFCNELITARPTENGNVANQRFDHIDDHFMGRQGRKKLRIDEWQYMEEQSDETDRSSIKKTHLSDTEGDFERKSKRVRAN